MAAQSAAVQGLMAIRWAQRWLVGAPSLQARSALLLCCADKKPFTLNPRSRRLLAQTAAMPCNGNSCLEVCCPGWWFLPQDHLRSGCCHVLSHRPACHARLVPHQPVLRRGRCSAVQAQHAWCGTCVGSMRQEHQNLCKVRDPASAPEPPCGMLLVRSCHLHRGRTSAGIPGWPQRGPGLLPTLAAVQTGLAAHDGLLSAALLGYGWSAVHDRQHLCAYAQCSAVQHCNSMRGRLLQGCRVVLQRRLWQAMSKPGCPTWHHADPAGCAVKQRWPWASRPAQQQTMQG